MTDEYKWDDIPDDDPRAVEHREKLWNELTLEEQEEIERRVAEMKKRIAAMDNNKSTV